MKYWPERGSIFQTCSRNAPPPLTRQEYAAAMRPLYRLVVRELVAFTRGGVAKKEKESRLLRLTEGGVPFLTPPPL
jgi:hypothetical protein